MRAEPMRRGSWGPRDEAPDFAPDSVSPALLARLTAGWRQLCEDERDSVIAATLVAADLARLGAPAAVLGAASRVIEDEIRHVAVCSDVLARLGAAAADVPAAARRKPDAGGEAAVRVARTLFAGFAVGEPMSAACFAAARKRARVPLFHWAFTELLRDEIRHGAFGIAAGEWLVRDWRASDRASLLWPACVAEMESFERRLGGPVPADEAPRPASPASSAVGLLSTSESCEAAVAAIPRWVLPPLERLGIVPR